MATSSNLASQLTSFFQSMYWRMVQRASANNAAGTGHISSTPTDINGGAGQPGNLGGGSIPIGNIAVYPDPNSIAYVKNAFGGNATVYTIVAHVSRKFAYIPRYVYEVDDPVAVRKYKHFMAHMDNRKPGYAVKMFRLFEKAYKALPPKSKGAKGLAQLLERPNDYQGQDGFYQTACSYYETLGECMIWCNRGTDADDLPLIDGPILEMYVLPPQYLEMVPDPFNVWGSLGWIFNVAGKRIPIDNENVIHIKQPNIDFDGVTRVHMRGMSPLKPGNKKLTEDESATDASVALNQNEGAKGILYDQTPGQITPTRETALRDAVNNKVNNRNAKGSVAVLQGLFGYLSVNQTSQEMELETRKDNIFDRICNLFGVPADLFKTGQTYQNLVQARKDLITNKILPIACSFRDEMNRVLIPAFGLSQDTITTDVDPTMIIELQDDMTELVTALNTAWWLSPNEKRKEMNQPADDETEGMDDKWIPNTLVRMQDATAPIDSPDSFNQTYGDPNADDQDAANAAAAAKKKGSAGSTDENDPAKGKNNAGGKNKSNSRG